MKISIVGWFNRNVGDEAFRCAHNIIFDGHNLEFVTPPNVCHDQDLMVLGGGAVASPFYLKIISQNPVYALGIDLAYESEADLLAQHNFREIYIRNKTDLELLRTKVSCPVHSIPDLAYMLKPSGEERLGKYKRSPSQKTLGVLVTDYVNPALDRPIDEFAETAFSFKQNLAKELDVLIDAGWDVIFIPCSTGGYGDDRRINLDIASFMRHQALVSHVFDTLSPQQMIDLIAQLDLTICMRLHAHIFSIIAGTPLVSISYTRKVKMLLAESNLQQLTAAAFRDKVFNTNSFQQVIADALKGGYRPIFKALAKSNYCQLLEVAKRVQKDWLLESP